MRILNKMKEKLDMIKENDLYRVTKQFDSAQCKNVIIEGRDILLFSSNSYLDLSNDERIKSSVKTAIEKFGTGSGGSRLTTGTSVVHHELEKKIAEFKGYEAALLFNTGYMANIGVITSLTDKDDFIFSDKLNHASIIDGCKLSKAKTIIYKHNDMSDLEAKILECNASSGIIVSDGVFSMDGDIVHLPKLCKIARKYGLLSVIDDAHATGVIGQTGRGTSEFYGLKHDQVDIVIGTLSKAIGSEGGFVCSSALIIDYLKNTARSFIFSTALAPSTVAASLKAFEILSHNSDRVISLQDNIKYFTNALVTNSVYVKSPSAIIPIVVGDETKALAMAKWLFQQGIFVSAIRYPTVEKGFARLRITLMATHTHSELDILAKLIGDGIKKSTSLCKDHRD